MEVTQNNLHALIGVSRPALSAWIARNEHTLPADEKERVKAILQAYTQPNPKRTTETIERAQNLLIQYNTTVYQQQQPEPAPVPEQPKQTEKEGSERISGKARGFLYAVFGCVLVWQIFHTAKLDFGVSAFGGWLQFVLAGLFGVAVQFTALLLTIHGANKKALAAAAGLEFAVNLLVFFPCLVLPQILISLIAAATIYSYAELFTRK